MRKVSGYCPSKTNAATSAAASSSRRCGDLSSTPAWPSEKVCGVGHTPGQRGGGGLSSSSANVHVAVPARAVHLPLKGPRGTCKRGNGMKNKDRRGIALRAAKYHSTTHSTTNSIIHGIIPQYHSQYHPPSSPAWYCPPRTARCPPPPPPAPPAAHMRPAPAQSAPPAAPRCPRPRHQTHSTAGRGRVGERILGMGRG